MYSQSDEEKHILDYFGDTVGRFYDIGAYDGKTFSNTLALLERGWSGVMVEPSPAAMIGLLANTAPHADRVSLVNAAVTVERGLSVFHDFNGDAVSTLNDGHKQLWEGKANMTSRQFVVQTLPLAELLAAFGPAEFINLDVEGTNWELFTRLPFTWPELKLICVEYDRRAAEMTCQAAEFGFRAIHRTNENVLLAR